MKRWIPRILVGLALLVMAAWMVGGHLLIEPGLREELFEATGIEPTIGFVLVGPDLNLYAYDIRFEDARADAHIPWAKFEIPIRKLWGSGRTRAVRVRQLDVRVRADADLTGLGRRSSRGSGGSAAAPVEARPPELVCDELTVRLEGDDGGMTPLLHADWVTVRPLRTRAHDIAVEIGPGSAGRMPFDGISTSVVRTPGHLLVSDFKMRAFGGLVDGMLDLHLGRAGRFNGEVTWHLLEAERFCRQLGLPYAEKREGKLAGELLFDAATPRLRAIKGSGTVRMERAHFWSPITFKVIGLGLVGMPSREESWIHRAEISFSIERALLFVESGFVRGADYELDVQGIFDLEGACDLEVEYRGTTLAVRGPFEDPEVHVLPLNALTVPFDRLYRERLDKRK